MTHICVSKQTIIGSDNGLSPGRRQAIIWTNARILSIGTLGTNFNEISIGIQTFSFKKMHFKMSSAKWRPFCLGLNVIIHQYKTTIKHNKARTERMLLEMSCISLSTLDDDQVCPQRPSIYGTGMCVPVRYRHSRLIPMYNARFILWPPSLSSPFLIWEENDGGHVE